MLPLSSEVIAREESRFSRRWFDFSMFNLVRHFAWSTAPELPTLPTTLDSETCVAKGLCPIKLGYSPRCRQIYYEVHGSLDARNKIVLIMGVNFSCSAWSEQVRHFSAKSDHAVLAFDNRGSGNSDVGAFEGWKSSDMAQDTLALLDWLNWNQDRSLHLFGISLGGMIAQELCLLIPKRFKSVTFISTRCGSAIDIPSKKGFGVLYQTISNSVTKEERLNLFLGSLFPSDHIDETTEDGRATKNRLREMLRNCHLLPREQKLLDFVGHFYAATMHCCSPEKLNKIAAEIKPGKILVITGDSDELIPPHRSSELHSHLPGSELIVIKNGGHALTYQIPEQFNSIMERVIREGNQSFPCIPQS